MKSFHGASAGNAHACSLKSSIGKVRSFGEVYAKRNGALLVLGVTCGVRISQLLALQVRDVLEHGKITLYVTGSKRHMKGKIESRTVRLSPDATPALKAWFDVIEQRHGSLDPDMPVFDSRTRGAQGSARTISRVQGLAHLPGGFCR